MRTLAAATAAVVKYKGKTMSLTRSLRAETNYGQSADPVKNAKLSHG
jgi:hypothetical protein